MALLTEKISQAPQGPGCYLFKNGSGSVIYVGKGKSIRGRVRQYFQKSKQNDEWEKIKRLVRAIEDVEFFETDTELDALLHEHRLIKQHKPWFNSQLKADKIHPYIRVDQGGGYATFSITPVRDDSDGNRYFGFFHDEDDAKQALEILNRAWKTPACGKAVFPPNGRACMNYHLGACMAPCDGKTDAAAYAQTVREAIRFLDGKSSAVFRRLQKQMNAYAEALDFEKAGGCKALLSDLERLRRKCGRLYRFPENRDVLLFISPYRDTGFALFYIRGGVIAARQDFSGPLDEEDVSEFLTRLSSGAPQDNHGGWLEKALTEILADKLFVEVPRGSSSDRIARAIHKGYTRFRPQ